MRDIAVCIVTVDRRPRRNYLAETLANLGRSGAWRSERLRSVHVVDSGGSESWPDDGIIDIAYTNAREGYPVDESTSSILLVHRSESRRSGKQNFAEALDVGARSGALWTLVLEDDVDVVDDFVDGVGRWLDDHAVAWPTCYPLCGNNRVISRLAADGVSSWQYPVASFWGFQAIVMRAAEAASVAAWLRAYPEFVHSDGRRDPEAHDLELHRWAESHRISHFVGSCPSFVQHVGVESFINPDRTWDVTFPSWPGREWRYVGKQQQQTSRRKHA
jgi:hypothetical protein